MSEREEVQHRGDGQPQQRRTNNNNNNNVYVHKPKRGQNKPGKDRRLMIKSRQFDDNLYKKLDGQEIPKTLRVSSAPL